jgi:zeaxanthin glucosyltransferase
VNALVIDGVKVELGLVPMHLGIPYVHVSNSLHYDFSGHTPLFAFDWTHETIPEAFARNKEGVRSFLKLLKRNRLIARGYAERVGLKFDCNDPLAGISKLAWLTQTPKRQNANRLRQAIANTNGLEKAVDLLEEALGLERSL